MQCLILSYNVHQKNVDKGQKEISKGEIRKVFMVELFLKGISYVTFSIFMRNRQSGLRYQLSVYKSRNRIFCSALLRYHQLRCFDPLPPASSWLIFLSRNMITEKGRLQEESFFEGKYFRSARTIVLRLSLTFRV